MDYSGASLSAAASVAPHDTCPPLGKHIGLVYNTGLSTGMCVGHTVSPHILEVKVGSLIDLINTEILIVNRLNSKHISRNRNTFADYSHAVCVVCGNNSSEKRFKLDNDDMVVTIESRLKLMTQKMSQLVNSWNEQTRGIHLDSDDKLRGLFKITI